MSDESILGLLLRSHYKTAAQAHGEEYLHHNRQASSNFELAAKHIELAIHSVFLAERYVAKSEKEKGWQNREN